MLFAAVFGVFVLAVGIYAWKWSVMPRISLTSPVGGEVWATGSTQRVAWKTENISPGDKISISIQRVPPPPLQTEGQEFDPIVFVNLENTGSVDWTVADMYPEGTYILTVTSYESVPVTNPVSVDSEPFTITHQQPIGGQKDAYGCLVAAGYSWCAARQICIRSWEQYCTDAVATTAVFTCDGGSRITATFYPTDDAYVDLVLSDDRMLSVPHAISASGARYAKADESFVFWNKGDTAFITENSETTFANCVLSTQ